MTIAIIGAGIVGASSAFYLRQNKAENVIIFDANKGQATKAAAGIICPWFSKRRHKAWYQMADLGAKFYLQLIEDLQKAGVANTFYQQKGVLLLKKNEEKLEELYALAKERKVASPIMGQLELLNQEAIQSLFPGLEGPHTALYASGAARVDGHQLVTTLLKAADYPLVQEKVTLEVREKGYLINGQSFDQVILASGAWLPELLEPLGYTVDVRPQKGQLIDVMLPDIDTDDYPLLMPEGEIDIIPFQNHKMSIGASHENDKGYDLTVDNQLSEDLKTQASHLYPTLTHDFQTKARVGTRAYTSDFSPFYGPIPGLDNGFAASGLGSTGLTVGPLIGKEIVALLLNQEKQLNEADYPIGNYVFKEKM